MGILKIIGALIFIWGATDLIMSWQGTDIWTQWLGIRLPDIVWRYSHYAAMVIGAILWSMGGSSSDDEAEQDMK